MREFFALLKKFDLKGIFITPTTNGFLQFFRYAFVGGIATVVDWAILYLLTEKAQLDHMISAIFGFVIGLIVNFVLSKLLVFKGSVAKVTPFMEFVNYAIIGVIGLRVDRRNHVSMYEHLRNILYAFESDSHDDCFDLELLSKEEIFI